MNFKLLPFVALYCPLVIAEQSFTIRSERLPLPWEMSTSAVSVGELNAQASTVGASENLGALAPGVFVNESGTFGGQSSLFIRGLGRGFTQSYFEGLRLRDASDIDQSFQNQILPSSFVGRTEIARGVQSGLYGSDAIGGVVNFMARDEKNHLDFKAGSYDQIGFSSGLKLKQTKLLLNYDKASGPSSYNQRKGEFIEQDSYRSLGGYLAHEVELPGHVLAFKSLFLVNSKEIDGGSPFGDLKADDLSQQNLQVLGAHLKSVKRGPWRYQLGLQHSEIKRDVLDYTYRGESEEATLEATYLFSKNTSALVFAEHIQDYADIEGEFSGKETQTQSIGLSLHQNFEYIFTSQTARLDHHSRFGNEFTYKLGAGLRLRETTILRSSLATGFKAPTLYQLYSTLGGDANLSPTTARGYDVGLRQIWSRGFAEINYFKTHLKSLIDYDLTLSRYLNIDETSQEGVELQISERLSDSFSLLFNATRLWAEDELTGAKLPGRPDFTSHLSLTYSPWEEQNFSLEARYKGKRTDSSGELPAYYLLALRGEHALGSKVEAYWYVRNLLNRKYEDVRNYGTLERSVVVGVRKEIDL